MLDADTLTYEGLMALIGRRVRIESGRYPFEPAIGTLEWVGYDGFAAGWSAWVTVRSAVTRYIPLAHITYFGAVA